MPQHTILIAIADEHQRAHLATHLDADGHTVYAADAAASTTAKLTVHPIDVLVLGELERPAQIRVSRCCASCAPDNCTCACIRHSRSSRSAPTTT